MQNPNSQKQVAQSPTASVSGSWLYYSHQECRASSELLDRLVAWTRAETHSPSSGKPGAPFPSPSRPRRKAQASILREDHSWLSRSFPGGALWLELVRTGLPLRLVPQVSRREQPGPVPLDCQRWKTSSP